MLKFKPRTKNYLLYLIRKKFQNQYMVELCSILYLNLIDGKYSWKIYCTPWDNS